MLEKHSGASEEIGSRHAVAGVPPVDLALAGSQVREQAVQERAADQGEHRLQPGAVVGHAQVRPLVDQRLVEPGPEALGGRGARRRAR